MRGLWLAEGRLELRRDLPRPEPAPGEVRVRVLRAGICSTDLELVRGYYPYQGVLGHEFVGRVEEGPDDLVGRRVVGEINAVCHECATCGAGRPTHCERRTVLGIVGRDGAFAEELVLPRENLLIVPEGLETDAAVFTEPLAAALQIGEQVTVRPSDRVLVVGAGRLGQLVVRTLALRGVELRVLDRNPAKRALLPAGAESIDREPAPGWADLVVECTGNPAGFGIARRAVRPRGTIVLKSTYAGDLTLDVSSLVVDEIRLVGSRCGPFAPALTLLASGGVDPLPLVAARYPLETVVAAMERAAEKGTLKVLIDVA